MKQISGLKQLMYIPAEFRVVREVPPGPGEEELLCETCERVVAKGIVGMDMIFDTGIWCPCGAIYEIV